MSRILCLLLSVLPSVLSMSEASNAPERQLLSMRTRGRYLADQMQSGFLTCTKFKWQATVNKHLPLSGGSGYPSTTKMHTKKKKEKDNGKRDYMVECKNDCDTLGAACRAVVRVYDKTAKDMNNGDNYCNLMGSLDYFYFEGAAADECASRVSGNGLVCDSVYSGNYDYTIKNCDECDSNPCKHEGTCVYGKYFNSYKCNCPTGAEGDNCENCVVGFKPDGGRCVDVCDTVEKSKCLDANKGACSAGSEACGGCLAGFKPDGDLCVDKCDDGAKTDCSRANKEACSAGAETCGGCLTGFKLDLDGASCVDVCDNDVKATCSSAKKEACTEGMNSIACGACKTGFKPDGDDCVDKCDDAVKTACSTANKEVCSAGTETCGSCKTGFKKIDDVCVDKCDNEAKTSCTTLKKTACSAGSTDCGGCLTGFKLDSNNVCVDKCDDAAKTTCSTSNKEACTAGTATCGECKEGYVADGNDSCVARQSCSAAAGGLACTSPAIKDNAGMCAGKMCDAVDFGDFSKACCMDNVCNADAKTVCSSANKQTCSAGSITCGGCKEGFVLDDSSCVARQECSAAANSLLCTTPAIKDNAGTCAGKECDGSVDFGDDSQVCCMYDVCDASAKTACSVANKGDCSPGSTTCGGCLAGYQLDGSSCVDVCDAAVQNGCASVNKASCSSGSRDCGQCLEGKKLSGDSNSCVDKCDAGASTACADKNKENCSPGAATCGGCMNGFKLNAIGDACEDVCDSAAKASCSSSKKQPCSAGTTDCGACESGYKSLGNTCVDVCDVSVQNGCASVNKATCSTHSTTCGNCLSGFKTDASGNACVDVCDEALRTGCGNLNKVSCSAGAATCGECLIGFKPSADGGGCIDVCDADTKVACSNKNMRHCASGIATCGGCLEGYMLDDKSDTCVDLCDSDAMETCWNANKLNCLPGNTTCGACKSGFSTLDDGTCRGDYSVMSHSVVLQGILASKFNGDENIKLSFRETISKSLDVPLSDIVNVKAEPSAARRRRFLSASGKATERKLLESSCTVSYDIVTASKSAQDKLSAAIATKISCGKTCSAAFTADFRTNMQSSNVDSDLIDSIQADSSASAQEADNTEPAKDQPADNQPDSTPSSQDADHQVQADSGSEGTTSSDQLVSGVDDQIVYGVGGLLALVVLIAVVMVVRSRCSGKVKKMRLAGELEGEDESQTFSKKKGAMSIVEMPHSNPMKTNIRQPPSRALPGVNKR